LSEYQQATLGAKADVVRSSDTASIFQIFIDSLNTDVKISVARANAIVRSSLANEFFFSDLASGWGPFSVWASVSVEQFVRLSELVSTHYTLEHQLSFFADAPASVVEAIESQERALHNHRAEVEQLMRSNPRIATRECCAIGCGESFQLS
jgi:hypothetical protein